MMKKILTALLLIFSAESFSAEFAEAFDLSARGFERQANIIVTYQQTEVQYDIEQHKKDMQFITDSLNKLENNYTNNPVFRFVQGLHARNMVSLSVRLQNKSEQQQWESKKQNYFVKAMALDKKHEPHLSAAAYASMKKGLGGEEKQQAIAAELKLGGSGENDSYYWYLHWSNINQLQKQGKITEAESALEQMRKELAAQGKSSEIYQQIANKAEQDVNRKKEELRQAAASRKKQTPEREHKAFTEDKVEHEYYLYLLFVAAIMLALVVMFVVDRKRRRKK